MTSNELSSGDIIRSKRVLAMIHDLENQSNNNDSITTTELINQMKLKFNSAELDQLNETLKVSLLLNKSSEDFYKNNIENNINNLKKLGSFEISSIKKNIEFPGLYFHKNGYLVLLLSTFNDNHLNKKILDFYKNKIKLILDLTRLNDCYVYRFYYDNLSRSEYLKIKRDTHCLWTYSLKIGNSFSYYRLTNFDHNIIIYDTEYVDLIFEKYQNKKRKRGRSIDETTEVENKKIKLTKDNEWNKEWVSASKLRNFMINDPLLDWLEEYRINNIYERPDKLSCRSANFNSLQTDTDFVTLIKNQGNDFEELILEDLMKKYNDNIIQVAESYQARDKSKMNLTLEYMKKGIPIIYQAVLHNSENKTYGCPDFLIRSDWINKIFGDGKIMNHDNEIIPAPNLNGNYHYVVLDIKCSTLHLNSDGLTLRNQGSVPAYKAQLLIYNLALGILQGYFPTRAYICGKKWQYTSKSQHFEGLNCYKKLGIIDYSNTDSKYFEKVEEALVWIRRVRNEGHTWSLLPQPSIRELYPNMCNEMDGMWRGLKFELAEKINEITQVLMCGPKNRDKAFDNGVTSWKDENCNAETLGISGKILPGLINKILEINKDSCDQKILPLKIKNNFKNWQNKNRLEFFIDFETLTSLFTPMTIGSDEHIGFDTQNYIFMIGLGWEDPNTHQWQYQDFTVNKVNKDEEERIITDMWKTVYQLMEKFNIVQLPNFYHWSHAEPTCYNKALIRHNFKWKQINFCDLLQVFKKEPIVIKGNLKYGLKGIAKAMYHHNFIETIWESDNPCSNGLTAMVLAWKVYQKNKMKDIHSNPIIQDIIKYNIIDCRVLWEIINYLRINHL